MLHLYTFAHQSHRFCSIPPPRSRKKSESRFGRLRRRWLLISRGEIIFNDYHLYIFGARLCTETHRLYIPVSRSVNGVWRCGRPRFRNINLNERRLLVHHLSTFLYPFPSFVRLSFSVFLIGGCGHDDSSFRDTILVLMSIVYASFLHYCATSPKVCAPLPVCSLDWRLWTH